MVMVRNFLPELLDRPIRQFPNLLSNIFDEDFLPFKDDITAKGARIYEEDNHLHVEVPLPGLNPKDIEVSLNKGVLLVKGEAKEEEKDKKRKFYRSSSRSYSYSVALPAQTDEKQEPQAEYVDGVLKVSLQLAKAGETKKIAVKAGNPKK